MIYDQWFAFPWPGNSQGKILFETWPGRHFCLVFSSVLTKCRAALLNLPLISFLFLLLPPLLWMHLSGSSYLASESENSWYMNSGLLPRRSQVLFSFVTDIPISLKKKTLKILKLSWSFIICVQTYFPSPSMVSGQRSGQKAIFPGDSCPLSLTLWTFFLLTL